MFQYVLKFYFNINYKINKYHPWCHLYFILSARNNNFAVIFLNLPYVLSYLFSLSLSFSLVLSFSVLWNNLPFNPAFFVHSFYTFRVLRTRLLDNFSRAYIEISFSYRNCCCQILFFGFSFLHHVNSIQARTYIFITDSR